MRIHIVLLAASSILAVSAASAQQNTSTTTLDEIVIDGQAGGQRGVITTDGYVATSGRSATKTDTPLLETPMSISTVTQAQLDDRRPQSLLEALAFTPGARVGTYGFDPRYDAFTIRGIDVTNTGVFRDGLRQINSPNGLFRLEPYGLEAISILRGPTASLYGASSSAGIVDLISKRPTATPFREVEVQTGSFGRLQGSFDLSGPVNGDERFLYRLTGLVRDADTVIGAVKDNRVFIAPAFTWRPTEATTLTFLSEYMNSTTGGTAAYINAYAPYVDRNGVVTSKSIGATRVFGGDGRYNAFRQDQWRIGYELDHRFNETFTLRQRLRYSQLSNNQQYVFAGSPGLTREENSGLVVDTSLETRLRTGEIEHKLLTGVDVTYLTYQSREGYGGTIGVDPDFASRVRQTQTMTGIYAQDQLSWRNWRLTLGGRYDWLSSRFARGFPAAGVTDYAREDGKFSGRAALSYVADSGLAPYISYGTSFTPNPGAVLSGGVAVPTTGEQVEAGVKYDLPGRNMSLRAAVFSIRQENAVVYEVVQGINRQVQLDLRSQGFELEGIASLANGLSFQASYSYNDARILKLTPETVGNRLSSVPYHMASAWLNYTVQDGPARGLGLGLGVRYVGSSLGDNLNRPVLDNKPRTLIDASIRYDLENLNPQWRGLRLQVNATNLLNEMRQTCTVGFCYFDEGRKVIASLRYRW
ncbi:Ferrichrome-iron receptor precursor [bacterium YEK0313]|nr:Ferrichrome-iron receptor precursor [bacterium YEK0313]